MPSLQEAQEVLLASSYILFHCSFQFFVCGELMGQMGWKYSLVPFAFQLRHELHTLMPPIQVSLLRVKRD